MTSKPASTQRARTQRGRRSRVLLVAPGTCDEAARLCERIGPQALITHNAFRAIGELTVSPAQEPVELVVLAESVVAGVSDHPARALRRVDPSVRVVLVRESNNGSPSAEMSVLDEEFDGVLDGWPSAETVMELLRGQRSESAEDQDREPEAGGPKPAAARPMPEVGGRKSAGANERSASRETSKGETSALPSTPAELGDVDLVEAVMRSSSDESGGLREAAIELIRQHTGWSDVALVERSSKDERAKPQATGSPHEAMVKLGKRDLGVLRSRKAAPADLSRWADWLARWLALDEDHRRLRELSERDELTGAFNRRYFTSFLADAIGDAAKRRQPVAVMVFDLDDFKRYNDEFGHAAGDEILRETVRLLNSVIRKSDRVCRIGGDEFAVVFTDPQGPRERGSAPPETAEILAQRFQDQVCQMRFPKLGIEAPGTLSVSAGLATFPWDGWDPEALLNHADALALQSKRKGKNAMTLGRGAPQLE